MIIRCKENCSAYGHTLKAGELREVAAHVGSKLIADGLAVRATVQEYVKKIAPDVPASEQREKRIIKPSAMRTNE